MERNYSVSMRHNKPGFHWYSFIKLYSALLCSETTHEKDPKRRMC